MELPDAVTRASRAARSWLGRDRGVGAVRDGISRSPWNTPASLRLNGNLRVAGDDILEMACEQLLLSLQADAEDGVVSVDFAEATAPLAAECAAATGVELEPEADTWVGKADTLPTLRLVQEYLDQDCHVLRMLDDKGQRAEVHDPLVLFKGR